MGGCVERLRVAERAFILQNTEGERILDSSTDEER